MYTDYDWASLEYLIIALVSLVSAVLVLAAAMQIRTRLTGPKSEGLRDIKAIRLSAAAALATGIAASLMLLLFGVITLLLIASSYALALIRYSLGF